MESSLTPKQKQILEWIEAYLKTHQTMPSRREIATGVGLSSPATIQQHIEALEKKGYLRRGETRESRALQWTARSKKHFLAKTDASPARDSSPFERESHSIESEIIPLIGTIAAGYPIEVFADPKPMRIPHSLFSGSKRARPGELYMLTVRGDSMIEDGILPEDWVILRKTNQARPGETVAALLNGEATLKRLQKTKTGYALLPANPKYPIIPVQEGDRFEIQGVLVGLVRNYSGS
ncbi:MAG: transcriptional repressor LexA [Bdellovibrionales bacterium]|nr:transcriptional repressor LexA [Bdellovibrionales bacterium]